MQKWKDFISFGTKYTIYSYFYANITLNYFIHQDRQQFWDPDYSYGFGYFDWHTGTITIQYNNYSGNRFPWRIKTPNNGKFNYGGFLISWNWAY